MLSRWSSNKWQAIRGSRDRDLGESKIHCTNIQSWAYLKLIRLSQCYLLLTVIELYWHNQKVVNVISLLLVLQSTFSCCKLLEIWVYQYENYNNLLIDSCLIINHRCSFLSLALFICQSSVFIKNVAVLPSLLKLSNAPLWKQKEGRTGSLHAPTNTEPRAAVLKP